MIPGALAACRSARNKSGWRTPETALQAEETLLDGIEDWLLDLEGNVDLVRAMLSVVANHASAMPTNVEEIYWADRVILRNTMQKIGTWLPNLIAYRTPNSRSGLSQADSQAEAQAELVTVAWSVPWERLRRERIQRFSTHGDRQVEKSWLSGLHLRNMWTSNRNVRLENRERRALALRRLIQIQLAVRLHQLQGKEPLRSLDQLLPVVSNDVLEDPYSKQTFGYRLTTAETLAVDAINRRDLTPGERIWSSVAFALARPDGAVDALNQMLDWLNTRIAAPKGMGPMATNAAIPGQASPSRVFRIVEGTSTIWSTGPDAVNNDGRRTPPRGAPAGTGQDWIVVVPPPGMQR